MEFTWYNRRGHIPNGVKWVRFTKGPLSGWGWWWHNEQLAPGYLPHHPSEKVIRVGRYRVALLRPASS